MTPEIKQRLTELREKYIESEDSQKWIDEVEAELQKRFEESNMKDNPVFKMIISDAQNKMNEINTLLLNDPKDISDKERKYLMMIRDVWKFNIERFGMKPQDDAIKLLTVVLDQRLAQ